MLTERGLFVSMKQYNCDLTCGCWVLSFSSSLRWLIRVEAYFLLLVDDYPPFSLF